MHWLQNSQKRLQKSNEPSFIRTANGTTQTTEQATDNVCDWDMFVEIQLLKESTAVLSLENLYEENGYLYELHPSHPSYLIKNGTQSREQPTTTSPWLSQACKQPITRPELRVTGSRHELWATMTYKWKLTYQNGFSTSYRRVNRAIAAFHKCLSG